MKNKNSTDIVSEIIGLKEEDAIALAKASNYLIRVICEDDEPFVYTADFVPSRINVEIKDNIIIKVFRFG